MAKRAVRAGAASVLVFGQAGKRANRQTCKQAREPGSSGNGGSGVRLWRGWCDSYALLENADRNTHKQTETDGTLQPARMAGQHG